jgi:hypothetical protein
MSAPAIKKDALFVMLHEYRRCSENEAREIIGRYLAALDEPDYAAANVELRGQVAQLSDGRTRMLELLEMLRGWAIAYEHGVPTFQEHIFAEVDALLEADGR